MEKSHRPTRSFHFHDCPGKGNGDLNREIEFTHAHWYVSEVLSKSREDAFPVKKEKKTFMALRVGRKEHLLISSSKILDATKI